MLMKAFACGKGIIVEVLTRPRKLYIHRKSCLVGVSIIALGLVSVEAVAEQLIVNSGQTYTHTSKNGPFSYEHDSTVSGSTGSTVSVNNGAIDITDTDINIVKTGTGSGSALYVQSQFYNPATVKIIGKDKDNSVLSSNTATVYVSGSGANVWLENVQIISTSEYNDAGLYSNGAHDITLINSSVDSVGIGLHIYGNTAATSLATLDGVTITSRKSYGVYAINATLDASNFEINSLGYGVNANSNSDVTLTDGKITTTGQYANGIHAANDSSNTQNVKLKVNNVDITTYGDSAAAIENIHVRSVINDGSVTTYGYGAHGITAGNGGSAAWVGSHVTVTGTNINTFGESGYGLVATTKSVINAHGAAIVTEGDYAIGARSHGTGRVNLFDGTTIQTSGYGAHGAAITLGSAMTIADTTITTSGDKAAGLFMSGYNTPDNVTSETKHVNSVDITNSTITSEQAAAIAIRGGQSVRRRMI